MFYHLTPSCLLFCFPTIPTIYYYLIFPTIPTIYSFPPSYCPFAFTKRIRNTLKSSMIQKKPSSTKFSLCRACLLILVLRAVLQIEAKDTLFSHFLFLSTSSDTAPGIRERGEVGAERQKQIPGTSVCWNDQGERSLKRGLREIGKELLALVLSLFIFLYCFTWLKNKRHLFSYISRWIF